METDRATGGSATRGRGGRRSGFVILRGIDPGHRRAVRHRRRRRGRRRSGGSGIRRGSGNGGHRSERGRNGSGREGGHRRSGRQRRGDFFRSLAARPGEERRLLLLRFVRMPESQTQPAGGDDIAVLQEVLGDGLAIDLDPGSAADVAHEVISPGDRFDLKVPRGQSHARGEGDVTGGRLAERDATLGQVE